MKSRTFLKFLLKCLDKQKIIFNRDSYTCMCATKCNYSKRTAVKWSKWDQSIIYKVKPSQCYRVSGMFNTC